jgi:hypothetical protein
MTDYHSKYLKYKQKYLDLKIKLDKELITFSNQKGGKVRKYKSKRKSKHKNKKIASNIGIQLDSEGMVYQITPTYGIYYCDRLKQYKFRCGELGLILLINLIQITKRLIKKNDELLVGLQQNEIDNIRKKGYELYAEKPMLKKKLELNEIPGTWTNEEYGFSGLQWMYIRFKSYQRFTETWSLLERCYYGRLLNFNNNNLRIVSLGGGPGFELLAFDCFMRNLHNNPTNNLQMVNSAINKQIPTMEYVSLDYQPGWNIYVEELGYIFHQWDIYNSKNEHIIGNNSKDIICMLSNILSSCSNEQTADLFENLLTNSNVRCILVNERGMIQSMVKLLEKRKIVVYHLLDQSSGRDDRQVVFFPPNTTLEYIMNTPTTFPNQPFIKKKYYK